MEAPNTLPAFPIASSSEVSFKLEEMEEMEEKLVKRKKLFRNQRFTVPEIFIDIFEECAPKLVDGFDVVYDHETTPQVYE